MNYIHYLSFILTVILSTVTIFANPGDLDSSFGINGIVTTSFGNHNADPSYCQIYASAIQADGKTILVGTAYNVVTNSLGNDASREDIVVLRYNSNGSLDSSFNGTGKVATDIMGSNYPNSDTAYSIAIQGDGKLVVSGYSSDLSTRITKNVILRYNANGNLDGTFGIGGILDLGRGGGSKAIICLQPDGKILFTEALGITRYNSNGSLDLSFNGSGSSVPPTNGNSSVIALQSDGKILVVGWTQTTNKDMLLLRYNANGTVDTSFNSSGFVTIDFFTSSDFGRSVALQSDGKIVLVGRVGGGAESHALIGTGV